MQKNKLNVLFTPSDNSNTSGAFLCMVSLCTQLQRKHGVEPFVVLPYQGTGTQLLEERAIPFVLIPSSAWIMMPDYRMKRLLPLRILKKKIKNLKAVFQIRKVIAEKQIDLVHNNTSWAYVGAAAALLARTPLVWHIREFVEEAQGGRYWNRKASRRLMNRADRIVAVSHSVQQHFEPEFYPGKMLTIHDGINSERFYCPEREILRDTVCTFIMVGGINEVKRQLDAVEACAILKRRGLSGFQLRLVGRPAPEYTQRIMQLIAEEGLENSITICGISQNMPEEYAKADIFLMCTKLEAFGRVTVEAMLSGLAVIGAESGGTPEIVQDGETGLLYEVCNSTALADRMEFAMNNREEIRRMAKAGQDFVKKNLTEEQSADQVYALYQSILREHGISI